MKIRAKTTFAGIDYSASEGAVFTVPDEIAEDLIRADYAEPAEEENRQEKKTRTKKQ